MQLKEQKGRQLASYQATGKCYLSLFSMFVELIYGISIFKLYLHGFLKLPGTAVLDGMCSAPNKKNKVCRRR